MPINGGFTRPVLLPLSFPTNKSSCRRLRMLATERLSCPACLEGECLDCSRDWAAIAVAALSAGDPAIRVRTSRLRWLPTRSFSPTPISRRQQLNRPPMRRLWRHDRGTSGSALGHASTGEESAASEPAVKDQAENSAPTSETLFRQFQAWATEQDAQPSYRPLVQDVPAPVVKRVAGNAPAANRLNQKRRYVRPVQNARAGGARETVRKKLRVRALGSAAAGGKWREHRASPCKTPRRRRSRQLSASATKL